MLGGLLNPRGLMLALMLAGLVLLVGYAYARGQKARRKRPGQLLLYESPSRTAAACRDLLGHKNIYDEFAYTLEDAPGGGSYITFTQHLPTQQPLQTVFLLTFTAEAPARFSLRFVREVFGAREPVLGEALLDAFFAHKLDARRIECESK